MTMKFETAPIVRAAQVWVCEACGGHDPKSCACDPVKALARAEIQAAKREATRQRVARHREKAKENNGDVTRYTDAEKTSEFSPHRAGAAVEASDEPEIETTPKEIRESFLVRAWTAVTIAAERYCAPRSSMGPLHLRFYTE